MLLKIIVLPNFYFISTFISAEVCSTLLFFLFYFINMSETTSSANDDIPQRTLFRGEKECGDQGHNSGSFSASDS